MYAENFGFLVRSFRSTILQESVMKHLPIARPLHGAPLIYMYPPIQT